MKYSPYSASKLGCYKDCPKKFQFKYVDKVEIFQEEKPFFEKGSYIHYELEYHNRPEPEPFKFKLSSSTEKAKYKAIAEKVKKLPKVKGLLERENSVREQEFSINVELGTTNDKDLLLRGYIDYYLIAGDTAIIVDWKTGGYYPKKAGDQLKLYAMWMFLHNENINTIRTSFYYVEHDKETVFIYKREDFNDITEYFINIINNIEGTEKFKERMSGSCTWCDYQNMCGPPF